MTASSQRTAHWTVVLRRKPARMVQGRTEGGYTDEYELVCCDCGDDPDLDYREVSPGLRRIRGPYQFPVGLAAYNTHVQLYHAQQASSEPVKDGPGNFSGSVPEARRASD
jgi:hypothetical protein